MRRAPGRVLAPPSKAIPALANSAQQPPNPVAAALTGRHEVPQWDRNGPSDRAATAVIAPTEASAKLPG